MNNIIYKNIYIVHIYTIVKKCMYTYTKREILAVSNILLKKPLLAQKRITLEIRK